MAIDDVAAARLFVAATAAAYGFREPETTVPVLADAPSNAVAVTIGVEVLMAGAEGCSMLYLKSRCVAFAAQWERKACRTAESTARASPAGCRAECAS